MLVAGALFHAAASLVQSLPFKFPAFVLSFSLVGIGNVFQVNIIYVHKGVQLNDIRSRLHRRIASSQLFNGTLNTNKVL